MKKVLMLVLGFVSAIAHASVVTYSFNGVFDAPVRQAFPGDVSTEPVFFDLLKQGDHISGTFTFDTAASIHSYSSPSSPFLWASYPAQGFQLRASSAFNAVVPTWTPNGVTVNNDGGSSFGSSYNGLIASGSFKLDDGHAFSTLITMRTKGNSALSNYRVPVGFDDFVEAKLFMTLYHFDTHVRDSVSATVDVRLADTVAVPEPATGLLLLAGLGGLVGLRRRR